MSERSWTAALAASLLLVAAVLSWAVIGPTERSCPRTFTYSPLIAADPLTPSDC